MKAAVLNLVALAVLAPACGPKAPRGVAEPAQPTARGVAAAALPFKVLRARGGQEITEDELLAELARAQAVCIGEAHSNPHHHWVQLKLLGDFIEQNRRAGVDTGLGMEMFQRPFQGVLDDYAAGRIDAAALLSRSGWEERWGYDWGLYSPMVDLAVKEKVPLVALNTPRELTKKVSGQGLDKLSPADRESLPELDLDDEQHRAWWNGIMASLGGAHGHGHGHGGHGHGHGRGGHGDGDGDGPSEEEIAEAHARAERIYAAQVLWDETMAEGAAAWLAGGERRQIIIFAGNGHCHDSAIVSRMRRRGVAQVVSVRPIIDDGQGNVAALLAEPENDYLFVMYVPER